MLARGFRSGLWIALASVALACGQGSDRSPAPQSQSPSDVASLPDKGDLRARCMRRLERQLAECANQPEPEQGPCAVQAESTRATCNDAKALEQESALIACSATTPCSATPCTPAAPCTIVTPVGNVTCTASLTPGGGAGSQCSAPGTVCSPGRIFDCVCTQHYSRSAGQCDCACEW